RLPEVEGGPAAIGGEGLHQLLHAAPAGGLAEGEETLQGAREAGVAYRQTVLETEDPHQQVLDRPGPEAAHGEEALFDRRRGSARQAVEPQLAVGELARHADEIFSLAARVA